MSMVIIPGKSGLGSQAESSPKSSLGQENGNQAGDYRAIDLPPVEDRNTRLDTPVFEELRTIPDSRARYSNGARLLVPAGEAVKISYVVLSEKGYAQHGELFAGDGTSQIKSIYQPSIAYIGVERNQDGKDEYRVGLMQSFKGLITLQVSNHSYLIASHEEAPDGAQQAPKKEPNRLA